MLFLERDPLLLQTEGMPRSATESGGSLPFFMPRRSTLLLWTYAVALVHFDRGIVIVAAMDVAGLEGAPFGLLSSFGRAALLSSMHSVGLALGATLAGSAFQAWSAKMLLILALVAEAGLLSVLGFEGMLSVVSLFVLRLLSGFAAAFPLVFLPLWVDEYGPSEGQAHWMAVVQLGAPLGQFLGLVVAGLFTAFGSRGVDWRFAFPVQALLLLPLIVKIGLVSASSVDVANVALLRARLDSLTLQPAEGSQISHCMSLFLEMRNTFQSLGRNPLYFYVVACLCCLHFSAAGLVLWSAPLLALGASAPSPLASVSCVALTLITAPTAGTYTGALVCDRLDGFKAGHHTTALRVSCGFLGLAAVSGPLCTGLGSFEARLGFLWLWFFGAGALLPVTAGVLMTSMPSYYRSFSAASSALAFHLLGFALAPALSAGLMDCFSSPADGLLAGIRICSWVTVPAFGLLLLAYAREPKNSPQTGLACADDLTIADIGYELARRRMTTAPL